MSGIELDVVARIRTDFPTKFGIPRQSGLADTRGRVVFEPKYRDENALKGLEGYSHLWLIWQFSETTRDAWSPTVKPPRLGGNKRVGVFATRSPFRPNPIGLSCVRLEGIESAAGEGTILRVRGADLMDGTPILDIKPYLPYADCRPEATGGFTDEIAFQTLDVDFPPNLMRKIPEPLRTPLVEALAQDPRPGYRRGEDQRRYGIQYANFDIRFTVEANTLRVVEAVELNG